ncbi:MAG: hypothetical protein ACREMJ_13015 [Gemmatimonadales bacterium]
MIGELRHGGDDRPLARRWAVLHEVRQGGGAPLDSMRTDAAGRYRLTVPRVDTAAIYFVSTLHHGVGYFSSALRVAGRIRAEADPIVVYDTASAGARLQLARRFVTVSRPAERGREVLELLEITNPTDRTRVAPATGRPLWSIALPAGVTQWQAGEGDLSPEAIRRVGDTVEVFAPIWPGAPRQLSYQYVPPPGAPLVIPLDQPIAELDLLIEDTAAVVTGARLDTLGVYELEGRRFAAYRSGPLEPGGQVAIAFPRTRFQAERVVPYLAGVAALALAWGLWVALKRKPALRA